MVLRGINCSRRVVGVKEACRRLNSSLVGKVVFSDYPRQDLYWILRLYDAAGLINPKRCLFRINDLLDQIGVLGIFRPLKTFER